MAAKTNKQKRARAIKMMVCGETQIKVKNNNKKTKIVNVRKAIFLAFK